MQALVGRFAAPTPLETTPTTGGWTIVARKGLHKYNYFPPGHHTAVRSEEEAFWFGLKHNLPSGGRSGFEARLREQ
jgi:hypothetical protein